MRRASLGAGRWATDHACRLSGPGWRARGERSSGRPPDAAAAAAAAAATSGGGLTPPVMCERSRRGAHNTPTAAVIDR